MVSAAPRRANATLSRMKKPESALGMRQILCVTRVAQVGNVTRAAALLRKSRRFGLLAPIQSWISLNHQ